MSLSPYYEHGGIVLFHGDCREVLPEISAESIDMVITDSPYGVSYEGRWGSEWEVIRGDSDLTWINPVFSELWRVQTANSLCLSYYGWPHADKFLTAWKLIGFRPVSLIVCIKNSIGLGYFTRAQHETAYLLAKGEPRKPRTAISDVFEWQREHPQVHPNQKPLSMMSRLVWTYTSDEAVILDPFAGSGTSLVAARNLRRRAIGIEIEERYCEIAATRLSQNVFDFVTPTTTAEQYRLDFPEKGHL
jgi:site-specific DNA-methyltransferase (adenine-specific)